MLPPVWLPSLIRCYPRCPSSITIAAAEARRRPTTTIIAATFTSDIRWLLGSIIKPYYFSYCSLQQSIGLLPHVILVAADDYPTKPSTSSCWSARIFPVVSTSSLCFLVNTVHFYTFPSSYNLFLIASSKRTMASTSSTSTSWNRNDSISSMNEKKTNNTKEQIQDTEEEDDDYDQSSALVSSSSSSSSPPLLLLPPRLVLSQLSTNQHQHSSSCLFGRKEQDQHDDADQRFIADKNDENRNHPLFSSSISGSIHSNRKQNTKPSSKTSSTYSIDDDGIGSSNCSSKKKNNIISNNLQKRRNRLKRQLEEQMDLFHQYYKAFYINHPQKKKNEDNGIMTTPPPSSISNKEETKQFNRWMDQLQLALCKPVRHIALVNQRANQHMVQQVLSLENHDMNNQHYIQYKDNNDDHHQHMLVSAPLPVPPSDVTIMTTTTTTTNTSTASSSSSSSSVPFLPNWFRKVYIKMESNCNFESDSLLNSRGPSVQPDYDVVPHHNNFHEIDTKDESFLTRDESNGIKNKNMTNENEELYWPTPSLPTSSDSNQMRLYYPMDGASLIPVLLLDLEPHHHVLDMCAAPGGKTIAIAQQLRLATEDRMDQYGLDNTQTPFDTTSTDGEEELGYLACNDISPDRRIRLLNVLNQYLPSYCRHRTHVSLGDATLKSFLQRYSGTNRPTKFDRILVDAPCTSERFLLRELYMAQEQANKVNHGHEYHPHVDWDHRLLAQQIVEQAPKFMNWKVSHCKKNAERQFSLLWNATKLCKMDGKIVYSTCALSPIENDLVVERFIRRLHKRSNHRNQSVLDKQSQQKKSYELYQQRNNNNQQQQNISDDKGVEGTKDDDDYIVVPVPIGEEMVPLGEPTQYGWQILPDNNPWGFGPIYCAVLTKVKK